MRTVLSVLLMLFVLQTAFATTYYFSSASGDDSRSFKQAQNSATPWKSIGKLNSVFSSLKPGDAILFKRGETFYGSININRSGKAGFPISIGAYGTGNRPIITALKTLSAWKANPSYKGVYDCSVETIKSFRVSTVLLNGVQKALGRFPNADAVNKGYLTLESHGRHKIVDKQLASSPNWKNAELVLRSNHWKLDKYKITSHSGHTIYYTGNYAQDNYGFFIQNSLKTLDQLGEWYYNPSTKKLSMYFGSKYPSNYNVKVSTNDNVITATSKSHIAISNLTLSGANNDALEITYGSNFSIKNSEISLSGKDGVNVKHHPNFSIENCNVFNSFNTGISVVGSSTKNAIVRNNFVKNTYYVAGMGQSGDGQGAGIGISSKNGLVEYNKVINSGYLGIRFDGDYMVVKNNYIDYFSFVKDDGAGIYTFNGSNITTPGRKVVDNVILNGVGAPEGTNTVNAVAEGIYLDGFVNGLEVSRNTVANCNKGIYLHNSRDVIVSNNTLFNNDYGQLHMKHDRAGGFKNQKIINNIFFSRKPNQSVSVLLTVFGNKDFGTMGHLDNNYYARPMNTSSLIYTESGYNSSNRKRDRLDLSEWKSKYKKDGNSKLNAKTFKENDKDNIKFVFNIDRVSKTISLDNTNYVDVKNIKYSKSITLKPYTSAVLLKDGASTVVNRAPVVSIASPTINQSSSEQATINIVGKATDTDGSISKVEFFNGSKLLHTEYSTPYTYTWKNVAAGNYILTAKATDNKGSSTVSAPVKVLVVATVKRSLPTVIITKPGENASFQASATIRLIADAKATGSKISKVELYNGTKILRTERYYPYTYWWRNVAAGTYVITAKAYDEKGTSAISAPVKVTVKAKAQNREGFDGNFQIDTVNADSISSSAKTNLTTKMVTLRLSPNPVQNILNVETVGFEQSGSLQISVMSASGIQQSIATVATANKVVQLDVSSLPNGVYIIRVVSGDKAISKQFVKL